MKLGVHDNKCSVYRRCGSIGYRTLSTEANDPVLYLWRNDWVTVEGREGLLDGWFLTKSFSSEATTFFAEGNIVATGVSRDDDPRAFPKLLITTSTTTQSPSYLRVCAAREYLERQCMDLDKHFREVVCWGDSFMKAVHSTNPEEWLQVYRDGCGKHGFIDTMNQTSTPESSHRSAKASQSCCLLFGTNLPLPPQRPSSTPPEARPHGHASDEAQNNPTDGN